MDKLPIDDETAVLVLTGAGVSAESGIKTFRDANGLWEENDVTQVASPEGFRADPELVRRFYSQRRLQAVQVAPNLGHRKLAELEARSGDKFLLVTQNVDGLPARAGSRRMLELHGNLFRARCSKSRCQRCITADEAAHEQTPVCEACGANLRPDIVWFGESLNPEHLERIQQFMAEPRRTLFLAVGTSGAVWPAAGLAQAARHAGIPSYLINREPADNEADSDHVLRGSTSQVLHAVL